MVNIKLGVNLRCIVVTPEKAIMDEAVDFVALPMFDGELGVLPGRSALIGRLGYGELRTKKGANVHRMFVDGGFVEIRDNVVSVLTQRAIPDSGLNVEASRNELEKALESGKTPEAQEEQLAKQARARAKLRMARRKLMEDEKVGSIHV